jgi:hypothetical protein
MGFLPKRRHRPHLQSYTAPTTFQTTRVECVRFTFAPASELDRVVYSFSLEFGRHPVVSIADYGFDERSRGYIILAWKGGVDRAFVQHMKQDRSLVGCHVYTPHS